MARIRTIKPEFFTSEDIVSLTPHARLLYIAMWCEADKEGRMTWRPKTLKMRYFPADDVCIDSLCAEIVDLGLVRLYGEGYACIPTFHAHQHINPRESVSQLPTPPDQCKTSTRGARVKHASVTDETLDSDAQVGREGKGRIGCAAKRRQQTWAQVASRLAASKALGRVGAHRVQDMDRRCGQGRGRKVP